MATADVLLKVPVDRSSCAAWLKKQDPPIVADALSLCEAAFSAVRRDVSEGEVARIEQLHALHLKQVREKFEREKSVLAEEVRIAKESADSLSHENERRHSDSQDVLRSKLRQAQDESARALEQAKDLYRQKLSTLEARLAEHDSILDAAQTAKRDAINDTIAKERSRSEADRMRVEATSQKDLEAIRQELASKSASDAQMLAEERARHARDLEEIRDQQRKGFTEQEVRFSEQEAKLTAARTSKEQAVQEALQLQLKLPAFEDGVFLAVPSLAEAWPLICRQRGEGVQMTVAAAAEQFEELMHNCQNFSKHIAKIVKAAKTQLAEAKHLEKIRDQMVQGIDGVRTNHPSLVPEVLEQNEDEEATADEMVPPTPSSGDLWATVEGQLFLSAFRAGKRGRIYPKEAADLKLDKVTVAFVQSHPDAFTAAKEVLQKEARSSTRGEKRKATASVLLSEDE